MSRALAGGFFTISATWEARNRQGDTQLGFRYHDATNFNKLPSVKFWFHVEDKFPQLYKKVVKILLPLPTMLPVNSTFLNHFNQNRDFSGGSVVKNLPANAEDAGSVPGLGRSPAEGNGNSLQYSCLGNPINRGDWQATVHEFTKELDTLSD